MTVSRVLRGLPVKARTRQRVLQVVDYFQKQPDQTISKILKYSRGILGVIIPSLRSPSATRMLQGIYQAAYAASYHIVLLESHCSLSKTEQALYAMIEHQVAGVLIHSGQLGRLSRGVIRAVRAAQIIPVCLGQTQAEVPVDTVQTDEAVLVELVTKYLWRLGHRTLVYLGERQTVRGAAFLRQCARYGCHVSSCEVADLPLYWYGEAAAEPVFQRLTMYAPAPTALVTGNGYLAAQLLRWSWEQGKRIPYERSILGCGDLPLFADLVPPLTATEHYPERIGQEAVALVLRRIKQQSTLSEKERRSTEIINVAPDLVVRASCGPPLK